MQHTATYTQYLQGLLRQHNIEFKLEGEYLATLTSTPKQYTQGPLETNLTPPLYGEALSRYARQMLLKQIRYDGQLKINTSKVALIGAGGIGCPLGLYLAGAGVGTLGLFDSDVVEISNLHRQIGHMSSSTGIAKSRSLRDSILKFNPTVTVNQHPFITKQTLHLLDQYDLVIDGSDNPQCRYLVNDYLMSLNRRLLSGACVGWQGQVTCYGGEAPCYRCIWGDEQVSAGGCSTLGVVGMVPGLVAMVLGVEAVKVLTAGASSLAGQLLTYDGRRCEFRKMRLRNSKPECIACGKEKMDIMGYNYQKYALCSSGSTPLPEVPTIPWSQAIERLKLDPTIKVIDVRPSTHFGIINLKAAISIPYDQLIKIPDEQLTHKLQGKQSPIFVSCKLGIMSRRASDYLIQKGFTGVRNIEGGINNYGSQYDAGIVNI